jgi:hypothetical protein
MLAMLDATVEAGPGDPCQCISKFHLLMLQPNRAISKHRTSQMSRLSAGVICPLVKKSPPVCIEIH